MKFITVKLRDILLTVFAAAALVGLLVGVGASSAAGVWQGKTPRRVPINSVERDEKWVALTFDTGANADKTPQILAILQEHKVPATYFAAGFWADKHRDALKSLSDAGVEIGTSGNTYAHMAGLGASAAKLELETGVKTIDGITGKKTELFRPPFGEFNDNLINAADEAGLYTILWDIDGEDGKSLSAQNIASGLLTKIKNGSIILLHDDGLNTVRSLPLIIESVRNKGYEFRTVGELIHRGGYTIGRDGRQIRS